MSENADKTETIAKLRSLLDECHTAMLAAGFHEDALMRRVKAEGAHARNQAKVHALPLAQIREE